MNKKRIERLVRLEGLRVVTKAKKRRCLGISSVERQRAQYINHVWTWVILDDRTEDGRQLKILTILDEYTPECLCIKADRHLTSLEVIVTMK